MEWFKEFVHVLTFLVANFTIIWWFRKESREDWLKVEKESKENWLRVERESRENNIRTQNLIEAIHKEMKDFHERLLKIEVERK